jgi:hypothetical protein
VISPSSLPATGTLVIFLSPFSDLERI